MARPQLPPGELGSLSVSEHPEHTASQRYKARGRMRLIDYTKPDLIKGTFAAGRRVDIDGFGPTEAAARRACQRAARERLDSEKRKAETVAVAATEARKVSVLADSLLAAGERNGELAASTLAAYRQALANLRSESDLLDMDVHEVRASDVATALVLVQAKAAESSRAGRGGAGAAKTARSVLNLIFGHAVRQGMIDTSPVREAGTIRVPKRRRSADEGGNRLDNDRALTKAERVALAWAVARSDRAKPFYAYPAPVRTRSGGHRLDVRDLVLTNLAVGARVGELCAVRWRDVTILREVDPQTGRSLLSATVYLGATVDRETGRGIVRHAPKTETSIRTIPVPRRIAALLVRRAKAVGVTDMSEDERPVFPNPGRWGQGEGWRDRSNTAAALRVEFDAAGFPWLSFHGLRRAAVTALADHLPIRQVADFAGHSSIKTTLDSYIGRSAVDPAVASIL